MTFKKNTWLIIIISTLIISCNDFEKQNSVVMEKYLLPNIDSMISSQVKFLSGKKVIKKVYLDGKEEVLTIDTDTIFWKSELSVFLNLEINKPSFIGAYNKDVKKNILVLNRKKGEKKGAIQVTSKTISNGTLISLSGKLINRNYLYTSEQNLLMNFDENTQLLRNYTFSGYQKMIVSDTVFFEISGEVK